jgi:tripartite-type tricarboxylate transporter receptor subunit TctC
MKNPCGRFLQPSPALVAASLLAATACSAASAQSYPTRPVRVVVSVQPGGNLDLMGRATAQWLTQSLGRQVIVENRPGANSMIGIDHVAKAAPDGHTLLMIAQSFLIGARMASTSPFDPLRDFAPISQIATLPLFLVVHPSLPARTVRELIDFTKARPGQVNYATSGNGSGSHLAMELFRRQAEVRMERIPYNGDGPALVNLLGGQVPVKFDNLSTSIGHVKAGRLRAIGVTTPKRTDLMSQVPAIAETLPGFAASIFNGIVAPAATPREIVGRLHADVLNFTRSPEHRDRFRQLGVELQGSATAEQFAEFLKAEDARYAKVIDEAGIRN